VHNTRYLITTNEHGRVISVPNAERKDNDLLLRIPASMQSREAGLLGTLLKPIAEYDAGLPNLILEHTKVRMTRPAGPQAEGRRTDGRKNRKPAGYGATVPILCLYPQSATAEKLPLILFAHGFEQSKEKVVRYAIRFAAEGFFVLMPDAPLHGERFVPSEFLDKYTANPHEPASWMNRLALIRDYLYECRFLFTLYRRDKRIDPKRSGMAGISMGGAVTLLASACESTLKAGVAFVPALDYEHLEAPALTKKLGRAELERFRKLDPLYAIKKAPHAALFIQVGGRDTVTGTAGARKLGARLSCFYEDDPSRYCFKEYPDTGHTVSLPMMDDAVAWFIGHI